MQIAGDEPDLILVTEVIPKAQVLPIAPALLALPNYSLYTSFDPTESNLGESGRRGIGIYVREALSSCEVHLQATPSMSIEQLWISLDLVSNDKLIVGCVYMSPSGDRHLGVAELDQALKQVNNLNPSHLLIAGDFNVPQIDWTTCFSDAPPTHHAHNLITCFQDHFLTQHVLKPTRFRHGQNPSTLDLILTNEEGMVQDLLFKPGLGRSDHVILQFNLTCYTEKAHSHQPQLNYNRGNYDLLRRLLQEVDWSVMHDLNVHHAYHFFVSTLRQVVDTSVPLARGRASKNLYIDSRARKLKREKASLWARYTRTQDPVDNARYCRCRNKLRKLTRNLRSSFERKLSRELKHNPKAFWRYSNSRLKTKVKIDSLVDEHGVLTKDDGAKASILNKYFSSVFTVEDISTLPQPPATDHAQDLSDVTITADMVRSKLKGLKTTSSPGPDRIHPRVLTEAADQLAEPLTVIYNKSIQSGCLPDDWKLGTVVPILKKGDKSKPENYRPVSLTAIPCKVLESIIRDQLMAHLEDRQLLSRHQHGFRPGRSCMSQLLEVMDDWTRNIERGDPIDAVYLDFRKAFDSVPHQRLLHKLESHGVTGKLKTWISSFLTDRRQQVVIRGCSSPWAPVTSGVPQGSVLGPTLFVIFINDLPDTVHSSIKIFADDTKIFNTVSSSMGSDQIQRDLDAASAWSDLWQLSFNEAKCKVLHIGSRNPRRPYTMRGIELESVPIEKDLGVHVDTDLKFRKQAASAAAKGNQMLALVRRSFGCIDRVTLPLLYKTLVRPHLEYGNLIWGPHNRADQRLIERVQRRATKLVPELKHLPYQERLTHLRLPSLYYRRRRGDMIAVYQIMSGLVSVQRDQLFEPAVSATTRGHGLKLRKPQAVSRVRRNALAVRSVNDWNALPPSVVLSATLNQFKSRLDSHWGDVSYAIPDQDQ